MPWFPVDDAFHSHPKVLATSLAALGLWAKAGSWCMDPAHITDGVVPAHVLASLGDPEEQLAAELVTNRLWRRTRRGYVFNDWFGWGNKRTAAEQRQLSRIRAENGRKGGLAPRNGSTKLGNSQVKRPPDQGERGSNLLSKREARAKQPAKQNGSPLDPIPIPEELPPNPPQAGGSAHDGQHPNCRQCGTNQRGPKPEPPPTPMPPRYQPPNGQPLRGDAVEAIAARARQAITTREEP